ncbi:MAG: efflux RND transporter permease subunit, partial [Ignavibacteriales bacterium]|nr:efflux RND transporter permease subunit [Ignavibacteriales bacterium]
MKLADVSISRPVFATMMIMTLVVLGLFSYLKLNVDLYPDVDIPYVIVTTILPGAGPEQIETDVTKKIEDAINTINGVDFIQSTSQENVSLVVVAFKLEVDGKTAAQDIREKVSAIRADLPNEIEDPIIQRYDPSSMPIMSMAISGNRSEKYITDFAKNVIKKRLENVPGVGNVELVGGAEREITVEVDADKLQSYRLSIQDVAAAVGTSNIEIPGGNIIKGSRQVLLRTMAKFVKPEDFEKVVVSNPQGKPIYLRDVARVVNGTKEQTSLTRLNGSNAVGINILKQSGSNTVEVANAVSKQLEKLNIELPPDINIVVAQDNSIFIKDSIRDVLFDIIYGGLLAVIVIYLFLANMRATIISALALPSSIIASFIMMYALNFTLNMMSLLALSLAVGLLIDDAIVVIENIYRHMDEGKSPFEAAKYATQEIGLAVMATTFTVVAVFVPVAFMPGIVGRFFYQFGITVSVAVLVSLFVAFTLTPMLSSRFLNKDDEHLTPDGNFWNKFLYYFNHSFEFLSRKYRGALNWSLKHRLIVIVSSIGIFVSSFFIFGLLGAEFFPETDQGEYYINIKAAPGSSLEQTAKICGDIETFLKNRKEVKTVFTKIGSGNEPVTRANIFVKLVKKHERKLSQADMINLTREFSKTIPGARFSFLLQGGPGGSEQPLQLSIRGENIKKLKAIADKVEMIIRKAEGTVDVDNSLELSKPEYRVTIDREKANDVAVNPMVLASDIRSMVDGYVASKFQTGDEQIDVRVKLRRDNRSSLSDIEKMAIKSGKNDVNGTPMLIPLSDVAKIENSFGPSQINRYDRRKEIRVSSSLSGKTLGEVLEQVNAETKKIQLEPGYTINVVGEGEQQAESFINMFLSL